MNVKKGLKIISIIGLIITLVYMGYLWKAGILTDQSKMSEYLNKLGTVGVVVFILIQIIQVIIPIIPGGISCVVGVAVFGTVKGLIYNYIGISTGSLIIFFIARKWGKKLLYKLFDEKKIDKYNGWLQKGNKTTIIFALLIASPIAPDDFLCYWAGTTNMKFKHYMSIILLLKPMPIAIYSLGLNVILQMVLRYVG